MTTETGSVETGNPEQAPAWYGDDAEIKGFVETKGWQGPGDVISSYRNLEKLLGADKAGRAVIWPKDEADTEGWKAIRSRLGVPEKPEDYGLATEDQAPDFANAVAPVLHEIGVSKADAAKLKEWWNGYVGKQAELEAAKAAESAQADAVALKAEWGAAYEQNCDLVDRAATAMGMEDGDLEAVKAAWGVGKTMRFLQKLGGMLKEDGFVQGKPEGAQLSPEAARVRLEALMKDKAWLDRFASGDQAAVAEKRKLDLAMLGIAA